MPLNGPSCNQATPFDENSWRVEDIPSWGKSWLPEEHLANLSPDRFFREYASKWKPVVIRGACRSWPAFSRWADDLYLLDRWGATEVDIYDAPNPQSDHPDAIKVSREARHPGHLRDLIAKPGNNRSVRAFTLGSGSGLDSMIEDIDDSWLFQGTRKPVRYPQRRIFIYKGCLSLWHKHPIDDHLTFQVRGTKDFVLLSPDQSQLIYEINKNELYTFLVDPRKYPRWNLIRPIAARLYAGDAIYIPPRWWHTVVPVDQYLGITLASVWGSSGRAILTKGLRNLFVRGNREPLYYLPFIILYGLTGWRKILWRLDSIRVFLSKKTTV